MTSVITRESGFRRRPFRPVSVQALRRWSSRGLHPRAWAVRAIRSQQPLGLSAGFLEDSLEPHVELRCPLRRRVSPKFKPPTGLALAGGYNLLGSRKASKTDKNNFQPRVGYRLGSKADGKPSVRGSYGLFYDHPLLGLYFPGRGFGRPPRGQLAFAEQSLQRAGQPRQLNAITIFRGCRSMSQRSKSLSRHAQPRDRDRARISPTSSIPGTELPAICVSEPELLNPATFLPLGFQPSAIRKPRTSFTRIRSRLTSRLSATWAGGSPCHWPTTLTAGVT